MGRTVFRKWSHGPVLAKNGHNPGERRAVRPVCRPSHAHGRRAATRSTDGGFPSLAAKDVCRLARQITAGGPSERLQLDEQAVRGGGRPENGCGVRSARSVSALPPSCCFVGTRAEAAQAGWGGFLGCETAGRCWRWSGTRDSRVGSGFR